MTFAKPILYLITSGATTPATKPASPEFQNLLNVVSRAASSGIDLIQIREKNLSPRTLFELCARASEIVAGSGVRLLVNDRADIAHASACDGVHLTARSLDSQVVRKTFGPDFLIGVSTHSIEEARRARDHKADFAVFGPVFDTPSKREFGSPLGLEKLREAAHALSPFPLIAIGGVTLENAREVLAAGASGIAAIRLFNDTPDLKAITGKIK